MKSKKEIRENLEGLETQIENIVFRKNNDVNTDMILGILTTLKWVLK